MPELQWSEVQIMWKSALCETIVTRYQTKRFLGGFVNFYLCVPQFPHGTVVGLRTKYHSEQPRVQADPLHHWDDFRGSNSEMTRIPILSFPPPTVDTASPKSCAWIKRGDGLGSFRREQGIIFLYPTISLLLCSGSPQTCISSIAGIRPRRRKVWKKGVKIWWVPLPPDPLLPPPISPLLILILPYFVQWDWWDLLVGL